MGEKRFKTVLNIANSGNYVLVSTVFTLDAGWETMVFDCCDDGFAVDATDLDFRRYYTEAEAEVGHKEMCDKWSKYTVEEYEEIYEKAHSMFDTEEVL